MKNFGFKRLISLFLVVMMTITAMPVQVLALERTNNDVVSENEGPMDAVTSMPFEETVLLKEYKAALAKILNKYLGSVVMSEEDVKAVVLAMDSQKQKDAFYEMYEFLKSAAEELTDAEIYFLEMYEGVIAMGYFMCALNEVIPQEEITLYATHDVCDGKVSITSNNVSVSNGVATFTATSYSKYLASTNSITVTNETTKKLALSFYYTADQATSLKIAGVEVQKQGSYTVVLDSKATLKIELTTKHSSFAGQTTATLKLSNLVAAEVADNSNVTFEYDSTLGSVKFNGTAINSGSTQTIAGDATAKLVATAKSGAAFVGWIDTNGNVISTQATYDMKSTGDMTVRALFTTATGTAWFLVNGSHLYEGLTAALNAVASASNKTIVLAADGTLPAGNYTIPSGVTLLIPYDAAHTLCTTVPTTTTSPATPKPFRTLTMASGANITVNGAISVSGSMGANTPNPGTTSGPLGFIKMAEGSNITVNSGAKLYVWGYIIGSGAVTIKNGGTVYENFQVTSFRGGDQTSSMASSSSNPNGVFPINQYYIQNVEVPMTLEAGATENGYMAVSISLVGVQGSEVPFIGTNGMFNITSGSITKDYDEATDRLVITVNGGIDMKSLAVTMKLGLLGNTTINSKDYVLPVMNNLTIRLCGGSVANITQDIAMLPGSELIIEKDATCNFGSGIEIYLYGAADWVGQGFVFNYTSGANYNRDTSPLSYAPGKTMEGWHPVDIDAKVTIAGTVNASAGVIYYTKNYNLAESFTAEEGAKIVLGNPGTLTKTYQYNQENDAYVSIDICPFSLDGKTAAGEYVYTDGAWGIPHDHEYTVEVVLAPTCTEAGSNIYTCTVCDYSYTKEVAAKGHSYNAVVTAPTCTDKGYTTYTCTCSDSYVADEVAALGHKYNAVVTAPTCTEAGYTTYTCSVCGDSYVADEVAALGHSYNAEVTAPTCTDKGYTTYTCTCGDSYVADEVAAKGHTPGADATCTDAQTCAVCGAELNAALGHSYNAVVTAPTCTEAGYTTYTCACGDSYVADEVAAKGHNYDAEVTAPTCTDKGYTTYTCSVCGNSYVADEVAALGHSYDAEVTAPTCTDKGYTTYTCSVCGDSYVADEVAASGHNLGEKADCTEAGTCTVCGAELEAALGHSYNAVVTAPTCTAEGYTTYTCSRCGDKYTDNEEAALGHSYDAEVTAPTCTEAGYTTYTCSVCGDSYVADEVAALGHSYDAEVTAPTCTEAGYTTYTCSVCGDSYVADEVAALGHTVVVDAAVAPNCTETGLTEGSHCSVCGEVLVAQQTVAALGHTVAVDTAVAPNCTETGLTEGSHCSVCGEVLVKQQTVAALGHTAVVDAAVAPTCTETGLTEGSHCSVCGEVLVAQQTVAALGHTVAVDTAVAPNCTETGLTEGSHCDVCDEVLVKQEVVAAKGHTAGAAATCTTAQNCTVCGTELVKAFGHTAVVDAAVAPTCTETGLTVGSHCSVCGEVLVAQQTVAAKGHTAVIDWEVVADCYNTGLTRGSHCSVCGEVIVKQEVIDYAHSWVDFPAAPPTRTENGYEAYKGCQLCGVTTEIKVIPALGEATTNTYEEFIFNLALLEEMADIYVKQYPSKDPVALVIKYIRTGVERYNSGSWGIMAGYEDADFAKFVTRMENEINSQITDGNYVAVTGLKNLNNFTLPNGQKADFGHVFGTMDITYTNKGSLNHADVGGWAGDLVDLLEIVAFYGVDGSLEDMVTLIGDEYFLKNAADLGLPSFNKLDFDGDLDAYYVMSVLSTVNYGVDYNEGEDKKFYSLADIFTNYVTEDLTDEYRAAYFMTNRLNTNGTRAQVRNAVYAEYLSNKLLATLEGTRDLYGAKNVNALRTAVCYTFADYVCKLAGDYVANHTNPYFNTFDSTYTQLAPGITQAIHYATSADGKQMVYYVATADITRDDVHVFANYGKNNPEAGWSMQRVLDQANAAQNKYGDPNSQYYIPNYNVVAATNGAGYNMSTGEPGGVLVMGGVEYHAVNGDGFFGILDDGSAVIGTTQEYNTIYRGRVQEAIACFGTTLVKNGEVVVKESATHTSTRASRTAVGITKTGKVVLMVLDGRQEPFSCGGSMQEIAQIMLEAGCVHAVNLDGGGSTTYVAKQPGDDSLSVVSRPSDGSARSVATSLMMVSTAPSSTEFDHAIIDSEYKYSTVGTPVQLIAKGISPAGNETALPEGYTWAVSDERFATVSEDGVFTGLRNGTVEVYMMLDGEIVGMTEMQVVTPENVYFTKTHMDAVYGANTVLPIAASFNNKPVAIKEGDVKFLLDNNKYGTFNGNVFVGNENSGVKVVTVTACLVEDESIRGTITLNMFKQGENTFDFDMATGGDRKFAWLRDVLNAQTQDNITYTAIDFDEKMTTSYIFAIDMSQITIPDQLQDLVYMLPGADMEGVTAWDFLLKLAERISVLTEITATIDFDDNVIVDISELNVRNEYFSLTSVTLDEETNTVTLKLNWIDQTHAIDPTNANPLCMVTGIKLTPKDDAKWSNSNRLNVVHSGTLGYSAYLRANALYSFAQKPENQEIFGLKPFKNPDLPSESGAYFTSVYTTFEDSYTLSYDYKEGWTVEDGGFAYYQDGEKLTGVQKIDGYYYDFGENGINNAQTKFTGVFYDATAGVYRYSEFGQIATGWKQIAGEWYYFRTSTQAAATGAYNFTTGVTYQFEENGRLTTGVWYNNGHGTRYYFGPDYYRVDSKISTTMWQEIDGKMYCFNANGYRLEGKQVVGESNVKYKQEYEFTKEGVLVGPLYESGLIYSQGDWYYLKDGVTIVAGLVQDAEGNYYYINSTHKAVKNCEYEFSTKNGNGLLPGGTYEFGPDGKMINPPVVNPETPETPVVKEGLVLDSDGEIRYYENGVAVVKNLVQDAEGNYYFINSTKKAVKNCKYEFSTKSGNGLLPGGTYEFGPDGKMINPPVVNPETPETPVVKEGLVLDSDGEIRYYENGVAVVKGLVQDAEGNYYYINSTKKAVKNCKYEFSTKNGNGLLPGGTYTFDAEGKLVL